MLMFFDELKPRGGTDPGKMPRGLFNMISLPDWIEVVLCIIALDPAIYGQHVLFHAVPLFWRLHMVHHTDMGFDVKTGPRFHTAEILLSLGIKCLAILLLGAPALSVLVFEVLLNATSMFNHGNVKLPSWLDHVLRLFIVTPDMHRVHHSVIQHETTAISVSICLSGISCFILTKTSPRKVIPK